MDRLDEWAIFLAVARQRSFVAAARALGRSPQAVTRAVAALEARLDTRLFNRTTRSVSLTDDGERYVERARRALAEVAALEARTDASAPLTGRLAITAPVLFGQLHVVPVVAELLARHSALDVRLALYDRVVSLAEEGLDVGVRIGALPDSSLRARVVGQVRSVVCASPAYLARAGTPRTPDALAKHACIAFLGTSPLVDRWTFRGGKGDGNRGRRRERAVTVHARLTVNSAQAAIDAALAGVGIVRVLSYQVAQLVADGKLRIFLAAHEPESVPVQLVHLPGAPSRAAAAFVALAADRLRDRLALRR